VLRPNPPRVSTDAGLDRQGTARSTLRIGGFVAIGLGIVLTGLAMIDFFAAFGSFRPPTMFWMAFIGLPLIAVGSWMLKAGYLGPATRYVAGEVTPALRDTLGALGLTDADRICASCGARNAADAKFCDDCGAALQTTCSACGATNAPDAKYCDDCGTAIAQAPS
jgi:ribosomal protein L40E